jgi:hypothetical protein
MAEAKASDIARFYRESMRDLEKITTESEASDSEESEEES